MKSRKHSSGPIEEREVTAEEIKEWLRLASTDRLNIFHDRNAIIVWLCRALLKERSDKRWF